MDNQERISKNKGVKMHILHIFAQNSSNYLSERVKVLAISIVTVPAVGVRSWRNNNMDWPRGCMVLRWVAGVHCVHYIGKKDCSFATGAI